MCGIAGVAGVQSSPLELETVARSLLSAIQHRGPDDSGVELPGDGVALIHTRLAILDLSAAGHQPMKSADSRYTIVFNGEIYNFRELQTELQQRGISLKSNSDTEVILELFSLDGAACVDRLEGMFAFAIWDRDERSLFLARDPLGIKPLYVWQSNGAFAFASEVRALLAAKLSPVRLDRDALARFLMLGSVQEPDSLVEGISQLHAGSTLLWKVGQRALDPVAPEGGRLSERRSLSGSGTGDLAGRIDKAPVVMPRDGASAHRLTRSRAVGNQVEGKYWQLKYGNAIDDPAEAGRITREALNDSVSRHFVSDVPVGIFLSGGIDSTAIVALAKANGFTNLQTFCISFDESEFNEGDVARKTAAHFGTVHTDWRMTASDAKGLLDGFLESSDSPSNDGFNTYCVSKLARNHGLKVVLSGLGSDELFGGYPSFAKIPRMMQWHRRLRMAGPLRWASSHLMYRALPASWTRGRRLAFYMRSNGGPLNAYWTMRSFFSPEEASQLVEDLIGVRPISDPAQWLDTWDELSADDPNLVGYLETTRYMRNQLLRDSDVMSMAHGLELRVPLADQRLYDTVNQISPQVRFQPGKRLLLDAVPEVPKWVAERPKLGFRFPFEQWVGEQWRDQFASLQAETSVPLGSWYRHWLLFTLKHYLVSNEIPSANVPRIGTREP